MSEQEKIARLLGIIAECQVYSIWEKHSARAANLLMELRVLEGGDND